MSARVLDITRMVRWIRSILGPLLLITICPPLVMLVWYTNVSLDGSVLKLCTLFAQDGVFSHDLQHLEPCVLRYSGGLEDPSDLCRCGIISDEGIAGRKVNGPVTPQGNVPVYKANGISSFVCTMGLFYFGASQFKLFSIC